MNEFPVHESFIKTFGSYPTFLTKLPNFHFRQGKENEISVNILNIFLSQLPN